MGRPQHPLIVTSARAVAVPGESWESRPRGSHGEPTARPLDDGPNVAVRGHLDSCQPVAWPQLAMAMD